MSILSCLRVIRKLRERVEGACRGIFPKERNPQLESARQQILFLTTHDPLTMLLNRQSFMEAMEAEIHRASQSGTPFALLFLGLDHFRVVNETLGHGAGDVLLQSIAVHLKRMLRTTDYLARVGGDEFCVLFPGIDGDKAIFAAERLVGSFDKKRFAVFDQSVHVTASAGLHVHRPPESFIARDLLAFASIAMRQAKEKGKSQVCVFDSAEHSRIPMRNVLKEEELLRRALNQDLLEIYFQPIEDLKRGRVMANEVLARIREGKRIIPAAEFIGTAEQFSLVRQVDRVVLKKALRYKAEVIPPGIKLFINLSGKEFQDFRIIYEAEALLGELRIPPDDIVFEITETEAITHIENAGIFLRGLRLRGIQFALDDFGSGFSSFHYLKYLDVDYVKIDKVFIKDLKTNPKDKAFARALNTIAHDFGMITVAEGVEDAETLEILKDIGIDAAQGYYIGHPAPTPRIHDPDPRIPEDEKDSSRLPPFSI